jgi:hypothetical protein
VQMTYPGQRVQVDVKYVPSSWVVWTKNWRKEKKDISNLQQ